MLYLFLHSFYTHHIKLTDLQIFNIRKTYINKNVIDKYIFIKEDMPEVILLKTSDISVLGVKRW